MSWTDARHPVPRLWIRSAEVRGGGVVRRMGTQQHLVCLHFPNYFNILFFFFRNYFSLNCCLSKDINKPTTLPGRIAQSVGHLPRKSEVLGSIPGLATYFRFSFR